MSGQIIRTLAIFLVTSLSAMLHAQSVCSTRAMVGLWAASSHGTVFPTNNPPPVSGPGACVGLVSIDFSGQASIKLVCTTGGVVNTNSVMAGTISVNPDCTGTLNAMTPGGWTLSEDIVVTDNGNEVQTIAVGGMLRGKPALWQCRWRRLARVPPPIPAGMRICSPQMARGTWAGSLEGFVIVPGETSPVPVETGVLTRGIVDHHQDMSGTFTASMGGEILRGEYAGSVIEVNPDCTGKWTYTLKDADGVEIPGEGVEHFVIVNQGQEIWSVPVQGVLGMPAGLARYRQISPVAFR